MRDFPLFIIDSSRSHGRGGPECDFIACTSSELPFVASVTILYEDEYIANHETSNLVMYSDARNNMRICIRVVSIGKDYDAHTLRSLLKRAIKEIMIRRKVREVQINDVEDDDVMYFCELQKNVIIEHIRKDESDMNAKLAYSIFSKIINDYKKK